MDERTIAVGNLSRVEGEGALRGIIRDGVVETVELKIFEPPRFFEALLVGRDAHEAPDITARICGICPVAYELSACRAIEAAAGVATTPAIESLRRLLYCGEWIQSHALHVYLLHAPDFFGLRDAVELAQREPDALRRGLELKKTGNLVMETIGGRAIHPVNVRVGGFYRAPSREQVAALEDPLRRARDLALGTLEWVAGFSFPRIERDYLFVALGEATRYAIESGRVRSSAGLDLTPAEFAEIVVEEHLARSTALHARLFGTDAYLTGPLARFALNYEQLGPLARGAAEEFGVVAPVRNPFRSIVVRAIELIEACDEALRLVRTYEPFEPAAVSVKAGSATGVGATEAPRGLLLHRYELDADGAIASARIVPPTSQNQASIEADLRRVLEESLALDDEALTQRCEQAVRNHDPCISCAAHFLDVALTRR